MVDWKEFRRADYSIDLIAAWRSQVVNAVPQNHHDVAVHFLKGIEAAHPIRSRQCAAIAISHANLITMQMNPAFESLRGGV